MAQALCQGALGRVVDQQSCMPNDIHGLVVGNNSLVTQLGQHLTFFQKTIVMVRRRGDFQYARLPQIVDQKYD
ncbi:hypothetical protein D3C86_1877660 [compost metagenome]